MAGDGELQRRPSPAPFRAPRPVLAIVLRTTANTLGRANEAQEEWRTQIRSGADYGAGGWGLSAGIRELPKPAGPEGQRNGPTLGIAWLEVAPAATLRSSATSAR